MAETAPLPFLRRFTQPALHRIAVNVPQFLDELCMGTDVEIVIALLPEVFCFIDQVARAPLLQRLDGVREGLAFSR